MEINGKPVRNGTRKIMLDINDRDVKKGQTRDPGGCAAAQCLMRTVPDIVSARVHMKMTYLEFDDHWERLLTPGALRNEIVAFDRGAAFYPGTYGLRPLSPSERVKYGKKRSPGGRTLKPGRVKRARPYHVTEGVRERGANK
jgi:hypothetical protein